MERLSGLATAAANDNEITVALGATLIAGAAANANTPHTHRNTASNPPHIAKADNGDFPAANATAAETAHSTDHIYSLVVADDITTAATHSSERAPGCAITIADSVGDNSTTAAREEVAVTTGSAGANGTRAVDTSGIVGDVANAARATTGSAGANGTRAADTSGIVGDVATAARATTAKAAKEIIANATGSVAAKKVRNTFVDAAGSVNAEVGEDGSAVSNSIAVPATDAFPGNAVVPLSAIRENPPKHPKLRAGEGSLCPAICARVVDPGGASTTGLPPRIRTLGWEELCDGESICFLDTETTGLSVFYDRVVEIGLACFSGSGAEIGRWSAIINAGVEIHNSHIHGITTAITKEQGIALDEALDVLALVAQHVGCFAGHNFESFDLPILTTEARRINHSFANVLEFFPRVDTLSLARGRRIVPATLENVCRVTFAGPAFEAAHHALNDALDCARCFFWLRDHRAYSMSPVDAAPTGNERLSAGKHKGKTFDEIRATDSDFCAWVRRQKELKSETLLRFRLWLGK